MRPVHLLVLPILAVTVAAGALFDSPHARRADAGPTTKLTPKQEALIELGRRLFFDPLVSRSGRRSCASCHDPDHGFSDPARVSDDDFGRTRRHSQTLVDGHLNPSAHWDGEFETVEELVLARVGALKGRKSRLAHGASLLEAVSDDASTEIGPDSNGSGTGLDEEDEVEDEEDIIDDGDDGGGGDDDNPYGGDGGGKGRGGKVDKKGDGLDKPVSKKVGPSSPGAKGPEFRKAGEAKQPEAATPGAKAGAKKGEPTKSPKKAAPKAAKKAAKKEPEEAKRPTPEELRARAEKLRADLRKLPLASVRLERGGFYAEGFTAAFGNDTISTARIARAVAAYCRSIESTTSPYDRHASGDTSALTPSAARGLALFRGRAGCSTCHSMSGRRAPFTDFGFHNTGVTWDSLSPKARLKLGRQDEVFRRKKDDLEDPRKVDEGRARISTLRRDLRSFKTPTLRDVARRGPYMHDGRFKTLEDVVRYYAEGTSDDPAKAKGVHGFAAKKRDVADLVAFLKSLSGDVRPGLPARPWRARADATRLRFVDADGKALAGLKIRLTPVGDVAAREVRGLDELPMATTDDRGWIAYPRTNRTHVRITLPGGLSLADGALVPDTCAKAKVVVPVRGKTIVVVRLPAGVAAPATLAAVHQGTIVLPGHSAPRTRLRRTHTVESAGANVVRYEGWLRTDVPHEVKVHLPGLHGKAIDAVLGAKEAVRIDVSARR